MIDIDTNSFIQEDLEGDQLVSKFVRLNLNESLATRGDGFYGWCWHEY